MENVVNNAAGNLILEERALRESIRLNIKLAMSRTGYTQKELADIIGVDEATFSNKLNGNHDFSFFQLKKICDEFYMTVDEMIKGV